MKEKTSSIPVFGSKEAMQMTIDSGKKCRETIQSTSLLGCLEHMLLSSSIWSSQRRLLIWKRQVTKSGRSYYQLSPSIQRSNGKEVPILYPTPIASIGTMGFSKVRIGLTKKNQLKKINANGTYWSPNLEMAVFCRPPVAQEQGIFFEEPQTEELKKTLVGITTVSLKENRINPSWVEWLMGFPEGWTEIKERK